MRAMLRVEGCSGCFGDELGREDVLVCAVFRDEKIQRSEN